VSSDVAVVRELSHQCGPGSILTWCHMWVEYAVGSCPSQRVFLWVLNETQFQFNQDRGAASKRFFALC